MPVVFQSKLKFKATPEDRIDEYDFVGGLVKDAHETKLESNQSPNMGNVLFNDTGSIKTRKGYTSHNAIVKGTSSDEANTGASTGSLTIDAVGDWVSQTFQVGTLASTVQVDFYLEMDTSGETQYMEAQLWTGATGPSALVAKSQIILVTAATETLVSFKFRVPQSLAATTEFAAVLKPFIRGSAQTVNTVLVHHTGNDYASGLVYTSVDSGITWTADSAKDLKFNVFTGGDTGSTGLIRYYNDTGAKQMFSKFGTAFDLLDDSTGVMTAQTLGNGSTLLAAGILDYTISNNTLLVVDRSGFIQKYRGSTNANYTTGTITATINDATVTGSGTSWNTSTNAEVGEYIKLPDGKWYKIISIASDTSLEIEIDYLASTSAGEAYTISPWGEVQGKLNSALTPASLQRPKPEYIENHINRVWTLEDNKLRFSSLDTSITEENFNDWDTGSNAGQIIIPSGSGDSGTGLYSLNNSLYVFQRRAIWRLYGTSPANFELRNVTNEIGMIDRRTLVEYEDVLIFTGDLGVYKFDGSNLINISAGIINTFIDTWANMTSLSAILWENKYLLSYTTTGNTSNDEAVFFDLTRNIWGRFTGLYAGSWVAWSGRSDPNEIYYASSNQGAVYKWNDGTNDAGYEITSLYDTPSLSHGAQTNDKSFKKFYIQQIALGDWNETITQFSDIAAETTTKSLNLSPGTTSLWDVAVWDTDVWSATGAILTNRISEFQGLAKYYKFRFEQTGYDEGIEILGITATSRVRRLR